VRSYLEPKSCRPPELVDQGFSLTMTCEGDDRETVHYLQKESSPKTGQILTKRRSRISPSKLRHLELSHLDTPQSSA